MTRTTSLAINATRLENHQGICWRMPIQTSSHPGRKDPGQTVLPLAVVTGCSELFLEDRWGPSPRVDPSSGVWLSSSLTLASGSPALRLSGSPARDRLGPLSIQIQIYNSFEWLSQSLRLSPLERTLIGGRDQQKEAKQSSSIHTAMNCTAGTRELRMMRYLVPVGNQF